MGKVLVQRLPVYPSYAFAIDRWCAQDIATRVRRAIDAEGWARDDEWAPGLTMLPKQRALQLDRVDPAVSDAVSNAVTGKRLDEQEIVRLFAARDADYEHVIIAADALRQSVSGDVVRMSSIATSTTPTSAISVAGSAPSPRARRMRTCVVRPMISHSTKWCGGHRKPGIEVARKYACKAASIRTIPARPISASVARSKQVLPDMHIHAFSPLEVTQGAATLGLSLREFLTQLKEAGLGTLPGTAAEILDDEVRAVICPDKVNTQQWLEVADRTRTRAAHHVNHHVWSR